MADSLAADTGRPGAPYEWDTLTTFRVDGDRLGERRNTFRKIVPGQNHKGA